MSGNNISNTESSGRKTGYVFVGAFILFGVIGYQIVSSFIRSIDISQFYLSERTLIILITFLVALIASTIAALIVDAIMGKK